MIGGTGSQNIEDWGEDYDPKTNTWEPVFSTTLDLTVQKSVIPGKLVIGGKVYAMDDVLMLSLIEYLCLVMIDNMLYQTWVSKGMLLWNDAKENLEWTKVKGLEGMPEFRYLTSSANSNAGRRVIKYLEDNTSRISIMFINQIIKFKLHIYTEHHNLFITK